MAEAPHCPICLDKGFHPHLWANRCRHCGRIGPVSMEEYRENGGSLTINRRETPESQEKAVDDDDSCGVGGFI